MKRTAAAMVVAIVATMGLTGCGGDSPYCETVKKQQDSLNTFGKTKSDAAYTRYAKVFADVAKVAPTSVKKDWSALSKATTDILDAQDDVGVKLEDMDDAAKVKKLDAAQLKKLNQAYEAFNRTTKQRAAVVKNVLQECDIKLK